MMTATVTARIVVAGAALFVLLLLSLARIPRSRDSAHQNHLATAQRKAPSLRMSLPSWCGVGPTARMLPCSRAHLLSVVPAAAWQLPTPMLRMRSSMQVVRRRLLHSERAVRLHWP